MCDVPIFNSLSADQLDNTEVLFQFLKAVTDKANSADRSSYKDAPTCFIVLVNLLNCAVNAKDLGRRKTYVARIMDLPKDSQLLMMNLIDKGRSSQNVSKRTPPPKSSPQVKSSAFDAMTPPTSSKRRSAEYSSGYKSTPQRISRTRLGDSPSIGFLSPGTRESPLRLQSIVSRQQREIDELREKLQDMTNSKEELSDNLAQQEWKHRQAMMSMETQSLTKLEDVQSTLEDRVAELQAQNNSLSIEARKGSSAIHELAALKEELAIHEGNQNQLEEANKKLHATKLKLQELTDVKGALLKEQEAHSTAIDNIVSLENEVDHLRPFQRQVEVYKKRAIEAEVKLVECQDCLKRLEKRANDENAHIFKDMMMQKSHLAELRQRLLDDTKLPSSDIQNGIGEGLSELNPQLKEELARLRNENVRLRAFQSQRSNDAVRDLEESLENAENLVEQFKSNHLATKESLRQTQDQLQQTEQREKDLEYTIQQLESKIKAYEEKIGDLENDCSSINEELSYAREECSNERLSNSKLQMIVNDLEQKVRLTTEEKLDYQQRLVEASDKLTTAQRRFDQMEASANSLNSMNEKLKDELLIKQHELESNDEILQESSERLAALHNTMVEKDQEMCALEKKLSESHANTEVLATKLEEERCARNEDAEEAQKALESTRTVLEQKLATDMKALQQNMNSLLEDERQDNRDKQRQAQELISSQESKWKEECKKLKEQLDQIRHRYGREEKKLLMLIESERTKFESNAEKLRDDYEGKIKALDSELVNREAEYETQVSCLKEEHEKKLDDLVHKGKAKIKLVRENAIAHLTKEREKFNDVVSDYTNLQESHNLLNERYVAAANEIEVVRNTIDETDREIEKLKDKILVVEREKSRIQEENEKFRRQLSGRQYADRNDAQNRLEKVTKELSILHEEHRKLKRSVRNTQLGVIHDDEGPKPFGRSGIAADNQAIQQITQEYEKKLSDVQEEKRELIMKNSAQVTDITRTEMKVHECEKAIQFLKSENVSLKLQIKRTEVSLEESNENDHPSATVQSFSPANVTRSSPSKIPRSSPSKLPRRTSPSIDRAKRQKATSEEFLRSRITGLKSHSPSKILSTVQSKAPSPKPPVSSGHKISSPSKLAYDTHRLNSPETSPSEQAYTIKEAMKNNASPNEEYPGECTQS